MNQLPMNECESTGLKMTSMPSNVTWFERLMIASIFVALAGVFLLWQRQGTFSVAELAVAAGLTIANFGVFLLLIWLVARRRQGWARYVIGALFALGLPFALINAPAELRAFPVEGVLNLLALMMQGAALVLIFTGNARGWFAKPPP